MSIQLVTYANQTVTPTNDAIIYERAIDQNGIFYGCNVTVSSNEVHITGGYGIICGREFTIQSEAITVTLAPSGTLDGRLYVRLDLADADNPIQLLTATGNTLPPLEQDDDVNYTNGTYEMELATFTVGVSALSDVVETFETIVGTKNDYTKNAWAYLYKSNFSGNNTDAKITDLTITNSGNSNEIYTIGTDQITINKTGNYIISITYRLSATSNQSNVKRVALFVNNSASVLAMARLATYEDCCHVALRKLNSGDVITMYRRFEDGNSTCEQMNCMIQFAD